MKKRALLLHPQDNCVVALADITQGDGIYYDSGEFIAQDTLTLGHKLATSAFAIGDKIIKYGAVIGSATCPIAVGAHIHSHNLKSDYIAVFYHKKHHENAGYTPDKPATGEPL